MPDGVLPTTVTCALHRLQEALSTMSSSTAPSSASSEAPSTIVTTVIDDDVSEWVLFGLARRCAGANRRFAFVGADVGFVGVGVAIEGMSSIGTCSAADDVAAALATATRRDPRRRFVIALPFQPAADEPAMSSWVTQRQSSVWAPRVWLHQRGAGDATVAVDLGDDVGAARVAAIAEAHAILDAWLATAPVSRQPVRTIAADGDDDVVTPSLAVHAAGVSAIVAAAAAAGPAKVVLARRRRFRLDGHVAVDAADTIVAALQRAAPREVRYLLARSDDAFFGCTPEWLCRRRGATVGVDVIAGTAAVGDDAFATCDKERREHEAVRRHIVSALDPVASAIEVPLEPGVLRLAHLQHLWSPVSARLREASPVFHLLHPTPAVAGVSTAAAVEVLSQIEGFDRGLYSGVVGVVDHDGEDLVVALRCAHLHDGVLDVYVGGGIVAGSTADAEWAELDRKELQMRCALAAVGDRSISASEGQHGVA